MGEKRGVRGGGGKKEKDRTGGVAAVLVSILSIFTTV